MRNVPRCAIEMRGAVFVAAAAALVATLAVACQANAIDPAFSSVTYGSLIKLQHVPSQFRLHSHQISWGSGSGQQSVTAAPAADDVNSMWTVREALGTDPAPAGMPVKCGSAVRLVHGPTGRYLHSHRIQSPLSGNQEVSGFGDERQGNSDRGDNWFVLCEGGETWQRDQPVRLKHEETGAHLYAAQRYKFTRENCGPQCPIQGQLEVAALPDGRGGADVQWKTNEGIYLPDLTRQASHGDSYRDGDDDDDDDDDDNDDDDEDEYGRRRYDDEL